MIGNLRIELQDMDADVYNEDELVRAVDKSVLMLSRIIPSRQIVETVLTRDINSEALTIASSTGTLTYTPIKKGSVAITGKVEDTDYRVNHLTGVVTEISSNLTDGAYTVSYELDSGMLDISDILSDYIKIEKVEYPVGDNPPTYLTFDLYGDFLVVRGAGSFADDDRLRIIYLTRWTAPTITAEGTYPTHLDNAIIIGSSGHALMFKAEKYVQLAADAVVDIDTELTTMAAYTLTAPSLTAPTAPTLGSPTAPTAPTLGDPTPPTAPTLGNPTAPTAPTLSAPTAPTAPTISDITAPTAPTLTDVSAPGTYSVDALAAPTLPTAPTAPTAISLATAFEDAETAIDLVGGATFDAASTEITDSKAMIDAGIILINAATRGDDVAGIYAEYADILMGGAQVRVNESIARLRQVEITLDNYGKAVASYGSDVNSYAQTMSGTIGKYREQINAEMVEVQNYAAQVEAYRQELYEESLKVDKYQQEVAAYQADINEESMKIGKYQQEVNSYQVETIAEQQKIDKFNAEVSLYRSEIDEELMAVAKYTQQVAGYRAEIEEEMLAVYKYQYQVESYRQDVGVEQLAIAKYAEQVRSYQAEVNEYMAGVEAYRAWVTKSTNYAEQMKGVQESYLNIGGRFLANGQAKVNEMLTMIGAKAEYITQRASSEQRS